MYQYTNSVYVDKSTPIAIGCTIHGVFYLTMHSHVYRKCGCKKCGDLAKQKSKYTLVQLIHMANETHGGKYTYSDVRFDGPPKMNIKVSIRCKSHGIFEQTLSAHIYNKGGCPSCGLLSAEQKRTTKITKTLMDFVLDANEIHGNKYNYHNVVYKNTHAPVEIICPSHGPFTVKPVKHLTDRQGCPICGMTKGELDVYTELRKHDIEFICQHKFNDCVNVTGHHLIFDFWIPSKNLLIEYDGEQHYRNVTFGSTSDTAMLANIQDRDRIKTAYAEKNGIVLLRIPFFNRHLCSELISQAISAE